MMWFYLMSIISKSTNSTRQSSSCQFMFKQWEVLPNCYSQLLSDASSFIQLVKSNATVLINCCCYEECNVQLLLPCWGISFYSFQPGDFRKWRNRVDQDKIGLMQESTFSADTLANMLLQFLMHKQTQKQTHTQIVDTSLFQLQHCAAFYRMLKINHLFSWIIQFVEPLSNLGILFSPSNRSVSILFLCSRVSVSCLLDGWGDSQTAELNGQIKM